MVKLIASDLDGTLLQNGAHDVNPIVFDQIRILKEHGILFAAASGRQYLNLRRLFTPIQNDIAYIAENGSLCIYNEETISKGIIEQDLAYRILDEVAKYPQYNCIISGERVCYSTSKNPKFYDHMVNVIKNNMKFIDDPKTEIPEPILKIAVCDYSGTDECEKHLKEMFSSDIKVVTSGNLWVDFICPTANKGSALKNLLDHLHIDAKDCVVFGDQYNDVEMLKTAGTSYAMANAAPGIDKYATHVTDSVEKVLQQIIDELPAV
jgi:Cof subfamily protein (haloacid dehalogenase superfamily)